MNYDKIIVEMIGRIQDLEERVDSLQNNLRDLRGNEGEKMINEKINGETTETTESPESGRVLSRKEIMRILSDKYGYSVRKGNRSEGSGIVATRQDRSFNIKVSYSRSYFEFVNEEVICSGWHVLFEKEINNPNFQYFVFVVADAEKKFHYFIFKRENIIREFDYKVPDAKKALHFYFRVNMNGQPLEAREVEKDMSLYYNNWDIFK